MTTTTSMIAKRLDQTLQEASPQALAQVMGDLNEKRMGHVRADLCEGRGNRVRAGTGPDRKIEDQMVHIRDTCISKFSPQDNWKYMIALSEVKFRYHYYQFFVSEIQKIEIAIEGAETTINVINTTTGFLTRICTELGFFDDPDGSDSPPFAVNMYDGIRATLDDKLRKLIRQRAGYASSPIWDMLKHPVPIDPVYGSDYTASQAMAGKPIPGSKELPLTAEQISDAVKSDPTR